MTHVRLLLLIGLASVLAGCGQGYTAGTAGSVRIVAAENFWGSIARQLGGRHASIASIITGPAQDPHSYAPSTEDARAFATAQLAIVNGIGYDPWATQLLAANPTPGRVTLNVGRRLGLVKGDNPHRWYDPADVIAVARTITRDLIGLDPKNAGYFRTSERAFEDRALARYRTLIDLIAARYARVPVGASESLFALLAPALKLDLLTPPGFMKAVSEGTEISPEDELTAQRQIQQRRIKVWIYNPQNATPQIAQLNAMARAAGIPVMTMTETPSPARDSFPQWQAAQLSRLAAALHTATGR